MKTEKHLTTDQISMLSEIIIEQLDGDISFKQVAETALMLFEDISGLEYVIESEQKEIIDDIWTNIQQRKT